MKRYSSNGSQQLVPMKQIRQSVTRLCLVLACSVFSITGFAQGSTDLRQQVPQLADLFDAIAVTQANAYELISEINADPATSEARSELKMHLDMMAKMTMSEMMASGMGHGDMDMTMHGPYQEQEHQARIELIEQLRKEHTDAEAKTALLDSGVAGELAATVFTAGHRFIAQIVAVYADDDIVDKAGAINQVIEDYLSDDRHSVASAPKDSSLLLSYDHAGGLKTAFPLVTGVLWSNQWLQLAALEALARTNLDPDFDGGIDTAIERYWNKIGSSTGMSMFPAPVELPMAPTIAPNLYSQAPQAAIIIDNLNVLETLVADILAYPNLENRAALIEQIVANFTNKTEGLVEAKDYLLFALRGGIYNQGGPAVGELMHSERNKPRSSMDMQHSMIMSTQ